MDGERVCQAGQRQGTFTVPSDGAVGAPRQSAIRAATPTGSVTVTGATAIHPDALTSLTVRAADGTVLATARI